MTRFVVDACALRFVVSTGTRVADSHELLTRLQADALVTLDPALVRSVEGIVATASTDALVRP